MAKNESVRVFLYLNEMCSCSLNTRLDELQKLVYVRNCIAHASGLIGSYKYGEDVRGAVDVLEGFDVYPDPVLGDRIRIEKGAVENHAVAALDWVQAIDRACTEKGILR